MFIENTLSFMQKILLVDDRPENLFALESVLENTNLIFLKAESGEEALKILLKEDVSLILLDVQMPGLDGFETAGLIRGTQKTRNIPIIFVTAISKEQKHIFKGYESGAVDYLFKPVEPEIVRTKVRILLDLDRQKRILEYKNQQLITAKKNTDNILTNVEEGIFLLGLDYKIKPQYSKALRNLFGKVDLANLDIRTLFKESLPDDTYEGAIDYLDLMFRDDINALDFVDLNPFIDCPFIGRRSDEQSQKYLTFNFKRIYLDNRIEELMVTVTDNTDQVILEKELEQSKADSLRQVDLLNILKVEPQLLKEFIKQTQSELQAISTGVEKIRQNKSTADDINLLYSAMHSVKGNSSLLDFRFITEKSHQFEETLKGLRSGSKDHDANLVQLRQVIDDINRTLGDIKSLIDQIRSFSDHYNNGQVAAGNLIVKAVAGLIKKLEKELGTEVAFNHTQFEESIVSNKDFLLVKDILIQLTRNAVFHGREDDSGLVAERKKEKLEISLTSEQNGKYRILTFQDNGNGIQREKLRSKAISSKKYSEEEISTWDDQQIAELIFQPGISTSKRVNKVAGRGMGMTLVKMKLDEIQGRIEIQSESGNYCKFKIFLPN